MLEGAHSNGRCIERKPENFRRAVCEQFWCRGRSEKDVPTELPSGIVVLEL
jgi:hypothetical protein